MNSYRTSGTSLLVTHFNLCSRYVGIGSLPCSFSIFQQPHAIPKLHPLLLANFFSPPRENNLFFGDQRPPMFRRKNSLSYAFPIMYVNIWCFFWSYFFSAHIFNKLFFLTFVATNYLFQFFYSPPPPSRYQMVRP